MNNHIFKSNGIYLGFLRGDNYLFSRDGFYLGWIESGYAWDSNGQFCGQLTKIGQNSYILKNMYAVQPLPKKPKPVPLPLTSILEPQSNISPISLPFGLADGF